ncbi:hypothetical protein SLOPH_652 [Spraguea lophii 42_110]|uniref:Uncharacterized protein n=1 Tax=Spraguea lophii (strain 42_110) TaxID=1358809 RepID=S7XL16_SPRLO|nr:hypothetical protein SLOPH_652 [Spraguea lophii 42_110]
MSLKYINTGENTISMYYFYILKLLTISRCSSLNGEYSNKINYDEKIDYLKNLWNENEATTTYLSYEGNDFWLNETGYNRENIFYDINLREINAYFKNECKNILNIKIQLIEEQQDKFMKSEDLFELFENVYEYNESRLKYLDEVLEFYKNDQENGIEFTYDNLYTYSEMLGKTQISVIAEQTYEEKQTVTVNILRFNLYRSKMMQETLINELDNLKTTHGDNQQCMKFINYNIKEIFLKYSKNEWPEEAEMICIWNIRAYPKPPTKTLGFFETKYRTIEKILIQRKNNIPIVNRYLSGSYNIEEICENEKNGLSELEVTLYIFLCEIIKEIAMLEQEHYLLEGKMDLFEMAKSKRELFTKNIILGNGANYKDYLEFCNDFSFGKCDDTKYQKFEIEKMLMYF